MKIVVDKLPETPRDCLFSERTIYNTFICTLKPYIENAKCKPKCICKNVDKCDRLIVIGDVKYE